MALTDDQLLDFDHDRLAHFELDEARQTLASEHGDLYRNHLTIAHWLDQWCAGLDESPSLTGSSEGGDDLFIQALREVGAHLRQGDLIPGGVLYDETWGRE